MLYSSVGPMITRYTTRAIEMFSFPLFSSLPFSMCYSDECCYDGLLIYALIVEKGFVLDDVSMDLDLFWNTIVWLVVG